ncbi:beta strand repeat-containing protein [Herminiimonas arsenitoxidans]|uniref:beta strand repeat-containing protein n=1 Tax=Herminiimonas arsenitoxidans TaxID=1809410 RepID=UPI0009F90F97|nr:filamentous hemagglutinin N-terminal domain-containing protein [Herminiimonas arsenitoxidans]
MNNDKQKQTAAIDAANSQAICTECLPPSITMRIGNRRLTLTWRPRKQMPQLLTGLLRRSWRTMFRSSLRLSMITAAVCAAWNIPAMAAAPAPNTLPTGGTVTYGNATFTQNGNTLNINQTTNQAIATFTTFSIGANATVDINQPSAAAAFLARVTGSDPSLIYGMLKSNGTVALINQNGILVGPTGVVDVARFIASTLNISDNDFLAGRLTFNNGGNAGNVSNQGTIKTANGGSVYLVGVNVDNSGIIHSPNGEVLLAAGQTVQLIDTGTPGVSVAVTGSASKVTNLGTITAEAGRIGIAAGLINNSGNINASSVVSEGGRIFLRASQNLTTTASSSISADGSKGGNIVLYADDTAYLDGAISAVGPVLGGGFVDTSGLKSLDVVNAPTIGAGGTWLIDPYNLEVVSDAVASANISTGGTGPFAVTSIGTGAQIRASSISTWLSQDLNVTLSTSGGQSDGGYGNINISAPITKSAGAYSVLTLNADGNIYVNANVASTSGRLDVNMISNYRGFYNGIQSNQISGATVSLNGGVLNVSDGYSGFRAGNLSLINGAMLNLSYNHSDPNSLQAGSLYAGNLTVDATSSIVGSGGPNSNLSVSGAYANDGTLTLSNTAGMSVGTLTNTGNVTLTNVSAFTSGAVGNSGNLTVTDSAVTATDKITNTGQFSITNSTINTVNGFINSLGATLDLGYQSSFNSGILKNAGTMNVGGVLITNATVTNDETGLINLGADAQSFTVTGNGGWTNNGSIVLNGASRTVNLYVGNLTNNGSLVIGGGGNSLSVADNGGLLNAATGTITVGSDASLNGSSLSNSGLLTMQGNAGVYFSEGVQNQIGGTISGTGTIGMADVNGVRSTLVNSGTIAPGGSSAIGSLTIDGGYMQTPTGVLQIDVASANSYDRLYLSNISGPQAVSLGGTLQSTLLNGYVPTSGATFSVINGGVTNGYFRNVLGDVVLNGGNKQMLKASTVNGANVNLTMASGEDIAYVGNASSNWGQANSWSTGYIPTAVDRVFLDGGTVQHASGSDTVDQLSIANGTTLGLSGGSGLTVLTSTAMAGTVNINGGMLTLGGATTGTGAINMDSGSFNFSGATRLDRLYISNGTVAGAAGSALNVAESFVQNGGTLTLANAALNQASGNMNVGNINANNLVLTSENGAITQTGGTALHVMQQLIASAATGITLSSANNQIAAFAANNKVNGNIVLRNTLNTADTTAVVLNGISNAGGNVFINNTGGTVTSAIGSKADFLAGIPTNADGSPSSAAAQLTALGINTDGSVKSATGSVDIVANSPLTIGSGGVNAASGIVLTAGDNNAAEDNLTINGLLNSSSGDIALSAGNNVDINANVATTGSTSFTTVRGMVNYARGVSITDVNGTRIPVPIAVVPPAAPPVTATEVAPVITPSVGQIVASVIAPRVTTVNTNPPTFSSGTSSSTTDDAPTVGGSPGTFGSDDKSAPKDNPRLLMCT